MNETVLVVGAGSIGRAIARLLRAVGVQVVGVDRHARVDDDDFDQLVATEELFDRLPTADHVVLALPLTPATDGLVDATFLSMMKPGAHLVNIGRGELVDDAALVDALGDGILGGASLDVFREEPLTSQSSLWDVPGLLVSPHMSGLVHDLREHMAHQVAENAMRFLEGRPLLNVVDKVLGFVEDR